MRSILAAVLLVAGCSGQNAIEREEHKLDMMKAAGAKPSELCVQMKAVTTAYLDARDQKGYEFHKMLSDSQCLSASIEGDYPITMTNEQ